MAINLTSPVTGAAITGLTSPTYTLVADSNSLPGVSRSYYVSALGGTQANVEAHTISSPFTISWKNPQNLAVPGVADSTGVYRASSRRNEYHLITRKGGRPLVGQQHRLNMIKTTFAAEAGVETADPAQLYAMLSLHIGALTQMANGIRDTMLTGAV